MRNSFYSTINDFVYTNKHTKKIHIMTPLYKSYYNIKKSGYIYNMHSYWTKQSIEVIEENILHYTKEGDTVLDCFSGTGMTGLAAIKNGRNAISVDISPICCHISRGYCTKVDPILAKKEFQNLMKDVEERIDKLYHTKCDCGYDGEIIFTILGEIYKCSSCRKEINIGVDNLKKIRAKEELNGEIICPHCGTKYPSKNVLKFIEFKPIEISYRCPVCKSGKRRKKPDSVDMERWNNIDVERVWYPKIRFGGKEPKRNHSKGIFYTYQMYSKKNLYALSIIYDAISKISDEKIRDFFKFVFTAIIFNVSLMSIYRRYENTAVKMGTLYIPSVIKDSNVIASFRKKFLTILGGNKLIFENTKRLGRITITNSDATNMGEIPDESIDYVYIDPPYSDIINYSELNVMWEGWLGKLTNRDKEIILDDSEGKTAQYYEEKMTKVFKELYRILKREHWFTLIFHHPKPTHWRMIQNAIRASGFQPCLGDIPCIMRSKSRTASQLSTNKFVQGFLILNFKKPSAENRLELESLGKENYENIIETLIQRGKKLGYNSSHDLYDFVIYSLFPKIEIRDFDKSLINCTIA